MKISGLLTELLTEADAGEALVEHLGNLDAVDKELLKKLVNVFNSPRQLKGIGWKPKTKYNGSTMKDELDGSGEEEWSDGKARQINSVGRGLGRGSKLENATLSVTELASTIVVDEQYVAAIIKLNDKQVCIITHSRGIEGKTKPAGYKESLSYGWLFTKAFLRDIAPKPFPKPANATNERSFYQEALKLLKVTTLQNGGNFDAKSKVEELIKLLAQAQWNLAAPKDAKQLPSAEAKLPKLDVILITRDAERAAKHAERKAARKGSMPVPKTPAQRRNERFQSSSHSVYTVELKRHLAYRLNAFKNSKSKTFDSAEDMLQHIIDEGYLDKLTFMGAPYNLSDDRLNFKDLKLGAKGRGESYVEYKSERGISYHLNNPAVDAAEEEIKQARKDAMENAPAPPQWVQDKLETADSQEARDKLMKDYLSSYSYEQVKGRVTNEIYLKHKIPPNKLVIKLVLDGGKIVPFKVELSYFF